MTLVTVTVRSLMLTVTLFKCHCKRGSLYCPLCAADGRVAGAETEATELHSCAHGLVDHGRGHDFKVGHDLKVD